MLGLALIATAVVLTLSLVALARAVHDRGSAQTAADLGALAAASAIQRPGAVQPCIVAAAVVGANGARITTCTVRDQVVEVTAVVGLVGVNGAVLQATATARAGPA